MAPAACFRHVQRVDRACRVLRSAYVMRPMTVNTDRYTVVLFRMETFAVPTRVVACQLVGSQSKRVDDLHICMALPAALWDQAPRRLACKLLAVIKDRSAGRGWRLLRILCQTLRLYPIDFRTPMARATVESRGGMRRAAVLLGLARMAVRTRNP